MAESVASNSPPPSPAPSRRFTPRFSPAQQLSDRILRALNHRLRLLHRSGAADFFVLGATGNVYRVSLSATPSCTCPDRAATCKHTLFVLIRVLGLPIDDVFGLLRRRSLRPPQLRRLLAAPTDPGAVAGSRARERFHQLFSEAGAGAGGEAQARPPGATCPVCLEEMGGERGGALATCGTCGNSVHDACFLMWRRSRGRRATCVMCRARWRERKEEEKYVNLEAYAGEDDAAAGGGDGGTCAS